MTPLYKHVNGRDCPSCDSKILEGSEEVKLWARRVREQFPEIHFAWVFRGRMSQEECVKKGTSDLRWPDSRHNVTISGRPAAEAFDVFSLNKDGIALWVWSHCAAVAAWLKEQGAPFDWGWDLWKKDAPHFQLKRPRADRPAPKSSSSQLH